ncbi:glycoside hydrolase family 1 protein [Enterobacter cloacae]|uniref:glycoside hydrolase family 1 protein n=1 Tax=Enterobacter cloacae TaxID=550 RepID=UPI0010E61A83|nr:glycoside hydrolase family 1 protein [Enterobacter cloacae]MBD8457615.1 glycoside hydrolase family 1 protein [Enterobacter cloacae]MCD1393697.1 glycoside hydrolase family 1 protein [Enterobacter cloacae]MCF2230649.1 glycoside hydrolase family 1 protein [Enterobacter cloacae]MCI1182871.1 glycoside hydrolase family 1 protein [Enterobacter cloacae]MCK6748773.1 glycoside hydrolase family 1 protein [Enterobacter cloacae]
MSTKQIAIPQDFILGAAASAWQTEGWSGKKPGQDSWIDLWYKNDRHVWHNGYGPAVATDFINRFREDVALMKQAGLTHYRTSINWSRFLTDYENATVDEEYAAYYDALFDEMHRQGIEPMICLEHYELPGVLLDTYGGWASKHVVELFVRYAEKVFAHYHGKVTRWFTFNEPIVVQTRVYLDALRWPYEQNTGTWMQWNHHKVLATAKVVKLFREKGYRGSVGCILNPEVTYPRSCAPHDLRAAEMYDLFYNRVFLDPLVHGRYPAELFTLLEQHQVEWEYTADELALIADNTVDELGINLYYPHRVKAPSRAWHPDTPFHPAYYYEPFELPGRRMNRSRGWEIYPRIIYDMAMRIKNVYRNIDWFVAESGMGVENEAQFRNRDGIIDDTYRIDFISEHLYYTLLAREEGANCHGYMLWAFTDNVSPMNAFKNRYGLIEIDLDNQRARRAKKSASWFRQLRDTRRLTLQVDDEWK